MLRERVRTGVGVPWPSPPQADSSHSWAWSPLGTREVLPHGRLLFRALPRHGRRQGAPTPTWLGFHCVTLGKPTSLSEPMFPHLQKDIALLWQTPCRA